VVYDEAVAMNSILSTDDEDVREVAKTVRGAIRTDGGIRGGWAVTKGVIRLKRMSCDDLEGGTLKSTRVGFKHALDKWVKVIRVGGLGEG
jgi:hypothetical protein